MEYVISLIVILVGFPFLLLVIGLAKRKYCRLSQGESPKMLHLKRNGSQISSWPYRKEGHP